MHNMSKYAIYHNMQKKPKLCPEVCRKMQSIPHSMDVSTSSTLATLVTSSGSARAFGQLKVRVTCVPQVTRICIMICMNMHKICIQYTGNMTNIINMQEICKKYARNMYEKTPEICQICIKYAWNMHKMQDICNKYARNMQEICIEIWQICHKNANKHARNMQKNICKKYVKICKKNAWTWYNMQEISKKICRKICKKYDKYAKIRDKYHAVLIHYGKYARK